MSINKDESNDGKLLNPTVNLPKLNEENKLSIQLYVDSAKQIITLSTTIVALVISFGSERLLLIGDLILIKAAIISWLCFFCSVFFGLLTIHAIVGMVDPHNTDNTPVTVYDGNIRIFSIIQWIAFGLGIILTIAVFGLALFNIPPKPTQDLVITQTIEAIHIQATVDAARTQIYSSSTPTINPIITPTP